MRPFASLTDAVAALVPSATAWARPQLASVPSAADVISLEHLFAAAANGSITGSLLHFGKEQIVLRVPRARVSDVRAEAADALERDGNLLFKDAQLYLPQAARLGLQLANATRLGSIHANVYVSRAGLRVARAVHTDPGAIFVLQTAGTKSRCSCSNHIYLYSSTHHVWPGPLGARKGGWGA